MLVPAVFNQFYQATEDYSTRFVMGSFQRFIRMFALVFSLIVPGLYVSFISFNPELLPTDFAVAVAGGRCRRWKVGGSLSRCRRGVNLGSSNGNIGK